MTDTSLSDRLRARADYLGTIMSGDPPVQLDAESPLLLRAAANTIDYLAPFQAALRLLGFGDEYCASADPIDYAKRWLAERLREDKARAEAERRLEETMTELNRICGLSFARISLAEAPRREEVEARLRRCGIEPDADLTGSVTLLLDKLEAAQHTNASLDLALRKRQATVDRQGNELGVLRTQLTTERKVSADLGRELDDIAAILRPLVSDLPEDRAKPLEAAALVRRLAERLSPVPDGSDRPIASAVFFLLNRAMRKAGGFNPKNGDELLDFVFLAIDDAVVATVAHRELARRLQQAELKVRSHELSCPRPGTSIEVSPKSDPATLAALGMTSFDEVFNGVEILDGSLPPNLFQDAAEKLGRELARRVNAMLAGLGPGQRLAVGEVVFPGDGVSEVAMRVLDPGEAPPLGQRWTIYGPMTPELRATLPPMTLQDRAAAFVPVAVGETEVGPVTPGRQIRDAGELVAWLRDDGGPNDTAQIRLDRGRLVVDEIPPQPTVESGHGQTDASGRPCDCTPTCDVHIGEAEIDDAVGIMIPVLEDIAPDGTTTWGEAQIVTIEAQAKDSVET